MALSFFVYYDVGDDMHLGVSPGANSTKYNYTRPAHIAYVLFSIGMVFAPHIGYACQLYEMYHTRNVDGYSPLVSFILLVSNSIRILYFIGRRYALALLFQSMFAIVVHITLLLIVMHIVYSVSGKTGEDLAKNDLLVDNIVEFDEYPGQLILKRLNKWMSSFEAAFYNSSPIFFLRRYIMWTLVVTIYVLLYYSCMNSLFDGAPEVIGYIALGLESLFLLPQILRNFRRHSTEGLTIILVLTWCIGDVIKIVYFVLDGQPYPFIFCGCFQLFLDAIVVLQVIYYKYIQQQVGVLVDLSPERVNSGLQSVS